jgi:hypothetical protein
VRLSKILGANETKLRLLSLPVVARGTHTQVREEVNNEGT